MTWRDTEFTHSHLLVAGRKIRVSHRPGEYAADVGEHEFAAPTVSELEAQLAAAFGESKRTTRRAKKVSVATPATAVGAMLLALALFTGCAARATTDADGNTTLEIDTRGGAPDSSRAVPVAPTGPAAATPDATVNALLAQIARAATALDWRGARQAAADFMEWAHGREVAGAPRGAREPAERERPAVAGVRERADEAFWKELER